jgi:hypothetical protein
MNRAILELMLAAMLAGVLLAPKPFDFYSHGPYDASVPRPESILGYQIGEHHTNFRDQERVIFAIAEKSKARVRVIDYGKSWEGRPLRIVAISSPENIKNLESIRKQNLRIANPKVGEDVSPLVEKTPVFVWVNECIHGDETASFESAMALVYNLAASRNSKISDLLREAVVIVNPVYNPDGHERYVVWNRSIATGSSESRAYEAVVPSVMAGRSNHYRFDMNRDRVAISQAETRQEIAEFLRWMPHVYLDQHGQTDNYFFPPNAMSVNVNVDRERLEKWTDVFGRATAKAFDGFGWTYFIRTTFDFYAMVFLDSWVTLSGSIGMTHETDGGRYLSRTRDDGSILTMREGAAKHFTSAIAVAESSVANRKDLLKSFAKFKQRSVSGEHAGKFQRVVVESDRWAPLLRLADQLNRSGVQSQLIDKSWSQNDANDYWSAERGVQTFGDRPTLVVDLAQAQGPVAKALLEPQSDFEKEFVDRQIRIIKERAEERYGERESLEFYDITGWALPYAYSLDAWWCESAPALPNSKPETVDKGKVVLDDKAIGYAIPYRDLTDVLSAYDALETGVRGRVSSRALRAGDTELPAGTVYFLAARNEPGYEKQLASAVRRRGGSLLPLYSSYPNQGADGPGSENTRPMRKPKIGVVFGSPGQTTGFGHVWYLLQQELKLPFTPLSTAALSGDLSSYSCILIPSGASGSSLQNWVSSGGCLIALGNPGWAIGSSGVVNLETVSAQSIPGSLFRAAIEPKSMISYGYPRQKDGSVRVAVPFDGDEFYRVAKGGNSVVATASDDSKKLLTGWSWPNDTEAKMKGVMWCHEQRVGRGHIILFAEDPAGRAMWPGLWPMLVNAIVYGASPNDS